MIRWEVKPTERSLELRWWPDHHFETKPSIHFPYLISNLTSPSNLNTYITHFNSLLLIPHSNLSSSTFSSFWIQTQTPLKAKRFHHQKHILYTSNFFNSKLFSESCHLFHLFSSFIKIIISLPTYIHISLSLHLLTFNMTLWVQKLKSKDSWLSRNSQTWSSLSHLQGSWNQIKPHWSGW